MSTPSLSSIMVHVDDGPDARSRVELAMALAERGGARLIGAAAAQPFLPAYAPYSESLISLQPEVIKAAMAQVERTVNDAKAVFDEVVGQRTKTSWRASTGRPCEEFLCEQARAADLVIVGRSGAGATPDPILGVAASDIVMGAGRPVLVVPPQVQRLIGKRVVVAWKDGREARRAAADALPLLRMAEDIFVAAIGAESPQADAEDVADALKAAGLPARTLVEDPGKLSAGDALIEVARRAGSDLIVAGAFGHSRLREWVFGGVTRTLLEKAPVCCLMSH